MDEKRHVALTIKGPAPLILDQYNTHPDSHESGSGGGGLADGLD